MKTLDLNLYFQCWRFELSKLHDVSNYDIKLLYTYYERGFSPQLFYEVCIELPF